MQLEHTSRFFFLHLFANDLFPSSAAQLELFWELLSLSVNSPDFDALFSNRFHSRGCVSNTFFLYQLSIGLFCDLLLQRSNEDWSLSIASEEIFRFVFTSLITCWAVNGEGGRLCVCMSISFQHVYLRIINNDYQRLNIAKKALTFIRKKSYQSIASANVRVQRCNRFRVEFNNREAFLNLMKCSLNCTPFSQMPFIKCAQSSCVEKHHKWKCRDNFSSIWKYLFYDVNLELKMNFHWAAAVAVRWAELTTHDFYFSFSFCRSTRSWWKLYEENLQLLSVWHVKRRQHLRCGSTASNEL